MIKTDKNAEFFNEHLQNWLLPVGRGKPIGFPQIKKKKKKCICGQGVVAYNRNPSTLGG